MAYLDIPQPTDKLSVSQGQIQGNFLEIGTDFAADHVALTDPTIANRGNHNWTKFITQAGSTAPGAGKSILYTRTVAGAPQLIWRRDGGADVALSGPDPSILPNGFTFLPGGIKLMWGSNTAPPGDNPFSFTPNFSAPAYSVTITVDHNSSTAYAFTLSATPTAAGFRVRNGDTNGHVFYWMAIGPA